MATLTADIWDSPGCSGTAITQEKEKKVITGKDRAKPACLQTVRFFTEGRHETLLRRELGKFVEYDQHTKTRAFIDFEKTCEIRATHSSCRQCKFPGITLITKIQWNLQKKNWRKTIDDIKAKKNLPCAWIGRISVKIFMLPKSIYMFNVMAIKYLQYPCIEIC